MELSSLVHDKTSQFASDLILEVLDKVEMEISPEEINFITTLAVDSFSKFEKFIIQLHESSKLKSIEISGHLNSKKSHNIQKETYKCEFPGCKKQYKLKGYFIKHLKTHKMNQNESDNEQVELRRSQRLKGKVWKYTTNLQQFKCTWPRCRRYFDKRSDLR